LNGARQWLIAGVGVAIVGLVAGWFLSVDFRCNVTEVRNGAVDLLSSEADTSVVGLDGPLEEVGVVARVEMSGSEWIDVDGWDSCLRSVSFSVRETLWETDSLPDLLGSERIPPLPTSGEVLLGDGIKVEVGEYFVFFSYWDGEQAGVPTDWWAEVVIDQDQHPPEGLDDLGLDQLAAILEDDLVSPKQDGVAALIDLRTDLFVVESARLAGRPFWEVGPRLTALLRFNGEAVRDYIGSPDLDVWLGWNPVDRHLGWARDHLPDGAADALEIEWGNGEVVVIHHTLTSDSVTSVGLLSAIGLTGPEALVPGGGEVAVRGQYARTEPLNLVLFDREGDIALIYPVPESILRSLDDRIAVAVDLDLRGAQNWRPLDRPPS
jgi:hypothetical protein